MMIEIGDNLAALLCFVALFAFLTILGLRK